MNPPPDVLIVGAGPTGLVLALWLARRGVRVRIVDKTAEPGTTSRAVAVQARTLEFYRQLGFADRLIENGRKAAAVNLWVRGKRAAHAVFGDFGAGLSPYPFALIFPQDEHERLLVALLAEAGVQVERQTELLDFTMTGDRVRARLQRANAEPETCEAAYVAGCDGAHSAVRRTLGIDFPGGTYAPLFYVADVQGRGAALDGEIHVALAKADFLAVFPLKGEGRARLIGTVREEPRRPDESLSWDDVSRGIIQSLRIDVERVNWFSTYRVHHRVAGRFQQGRAFLLGDAAHIHSPVGGQGMNTGIGDAVNLAWKLAEVLQGRADASLLASYEPERLAFARRLVATTDRAFTGVTSAGLLARGFRLHLVPRLIPLVPKIAVIRRLLFRTVSQIAINYRGSALSEGHAGKARAGDRLPWLAGDARPGSKDNFEALASLSWQVHVYGSASSELKAACAKHHLSLQLFPWRPEIVRTGLCRDALYLVRPDGYIAFAGAAGQLSTLSAYLETRALSV